MKNKLIVFEGIDGAGKATQVKMLAARLRKAGRTVTTFSFPRYGTPIGSLIKSALSGAYGDYHAIPSYHGSLPYSIDRAIAAHRIHSALQKGVVISDRYTPTNFAFGGALTPAKELQKFIRFFEQLEYQEFKVPKPDVIVYLSLPAATTHARLKKEAGKRLDQNERNTAFQKKVAAIYEQLSKKRGWVRIECGEHESPKEIHEKVWKALQ